MAADSDKAEWTLTFEEVRILKDDPKYILIDVREKFEVESGAIPGAINIPLDEIDVALNELSPVEFRKRYCVEKPAKDSNIIFSCRSGRRSGIACEKAAAFGYISVFNYLGSWLDWEKNMKE